MELGECCDDCLLIMCPDLTPIKKEIKKSAMKVNLNVVATQRYMNKVHSCYLVYLYIINVHGKSLIYFLEYKIYSIGSVLLKVFCKILKNNQELSFVPANEEMQRWNCILT